MARLTMTVALAGTLALIGCAVAPPSGPSVLVLPEKGKSFAQFQQEDATCRQYALQRIGYGSPAQAANDSAVASAAVGTVLGTAAGALIGAAAGNAGVGAAIGAGSGLLLGSAWGIDAAQASGATLQNRYDMSYAQCMYANGNRVPMAEGRPRPYRGYPYGRYYPMYPSYYYSPYPGYY